MPTTNTYSDQTVISRNPDNTVRNIHVNDVLQVLDDTGKVTSTSPLPPRDITKDELTDLFGPTFLVQQQQITDLQGQITSAKTASDAAANQALKDIQAAKDAGTAAVQAANDKAAADSQTASQAAAGQLAKVQASADKATDDLQTAQAQVADLTAKLAAATAPQTGSTDGYTVPNTTPPIVLDDSEDAQTRFTSVVTLIQLAQAKNLVQDDTPQTFADRAGNLQTLPTDAFLLAMLGYGQHCQALFTAALKK